ncbi:MAG: LacI family DNA-binding transcriptional regulator [Spirochaetales bacterium]|nr:LacI family DNA-binding transcriptional regulator [Spirochaetales bacterium]
MIDKNNKPTIYDVAKLSGFSSATVSLALSGSTKIKETTKRKIRNAADKLKYHPNFLDRGLVKQKTKTICLIIPDNLNPVFAEITQGVEHIAYSRGYSIILCITNEDAKREKFYLDIMRNNRADGLLIFPTFFPVVQEEALKLKASNIPFVIVGRRIEGITSCYVTADLELGGYKVADYLIKLGHRKIGIIYGVANPDLGKSRMEGFKRAYLENGIQFNPELVKGCGYKIHDGYKVAKEFLSMENRPTALFAINDLLAIGALKAIKESGLRVPEDISIAGFDNIEFAYYSDPALTTISLKEKEMGKAAIEMLIDEIEHTSKDGQSTSILIEPELVVRDSCSKIG